MSKQVVVATFIISIAGLVAEFMAFLPLGDSSNWHELQGLLNSLNLISFSYSYLLYHNMGPGVWLAYGHPLLFAYY